MVRLILGRAGSGKTTRLLDAVKRRAENGVRGQIVLVPEQFSLQAERALCRVCGNSISLSAEVFTFRSLATRVFDELGGGNASVLDEGGRLLTMYLAVSNIRSQLRVYGNTALRPEFLKKLVALSEELKSYRVDPADLLVLEGSGGTLPDKLHDIAAISGAYDAILSAECKDPADRLQRLERALEGKGYFAGRYISIDGFNGFTAAELAVLAVMFREADEVCITLCADGVHDDEFGMGVFSHVKQTVAAIMALCRKSAITCEVDRSELACRRFADPTSDLAMVERGLFDYTAPAKQGTDGSVILYEAESAYSECEAAAAEIRKLLMRGYRQHEIAVVTRDLQSYRQIAETVFAKYGLTVFSDRTSDAAQKQPIRLLCAAAEIAAKGCSLARMLRLIKTGLAGILLAEADVLERYAVMWNVSGAVWLSENGFTAHPNGYGAPFDDESRETLEQINQLRRRVAEPLKQMLAAAKAGSAKARTEALYAYAEAVGLAEALAVRAETCSDVRTAAEYQQLWSLIVTCFDQCALILGEIPLSAQEFFELFRLLVSQYRIGTIPTGLDCIPIGDASRMRTDRPRAVFVLGVCDGVFPPKAVEGGILTQSDRKKLFDDAGIALSPANEDRIAWEQLIAYQTLSAPREILWVSYPRTAQPSYLVDRISAILPDLARRTEADEGAVYKTYAQMPCVELAAGALNAARADVLSASAYHVMAEARPESLQRAANAAEGSRGVLAAPTTVQKIYGKEPVLTASRLEKFRTCRFAHFVRYGLKAEPRKKAVFAAAETGTFLHYVLEHTAADFAAAKAQTEDTAALEELLCNAAQIHIDTYIETFLGGLENKPRRLAYTIERLTKNVFEILHSMVEEFAASSFIPVGFEVRLGTPTEPFAYDTGNGQTVRISGVVDRIDCWEVGGKKFIRVVDYKSGNKAFSYKDVENGFGIQLLLYLFALLADDPSLRPAGVLYKPVGKRPVALKPGMSSEEMANEIRKAERCKGIVLDDDGVILAMEAVPDGARERFIPVAIDGGKINRSRSSLVSMQQFGILKGHISRLLRSTRDALLAGDIACDPYAGACDFCDYHRICRFDPSNGKDGYREIASVRKNDFFEQHAEEETEV